MTHINIPRELFSEAVQTIKLVASFECRCDLSVGYVCEACYAKRLLARLELVQASAYTEPPMNPEVLGKLLVSIPMCEAPSTDLPLPTDLVASSERINTFLGYLGRGDASAESVDLTC